MKTTTNDVYYALNCGQPVLHRHGQPVAAPMDAVGIAYSEETDETIFILHKFGQAERVKSWLESTHRKLSGTGSDWASKLKYFEIRVPMPPGAFPVDLLNEAIRGDTKALNELISREGAIDVEAVEVPHTTQRML